MTTTFEMHDLQNTYAYEVKTTEQAQLESIFNMRKTEKKKPSPVLQTKFYYFEPNWGYTLVPFRAGCQHNFFAFSLRPILNFDFYFLRDRTLN